MRILSVVLFLVFVSKLPAQTFTTTINEWIPDDGTVVYQDIEVSGLPNSIGSEFGLVQVCLNMDHTYDSDMNVSLRSPDGSLFLLFSGIGGGDDNWTDCCMRDDAADPIYAGSAPYTGTFRPMGNMGVVNNGQDPNGTWTLILLDTYPFADQGYLYDFSIGFDVDAPVPFVFTSSNLPIAKIFTDGTPIMNEPKIPATLQIIDHGNGELNYFTDTDYAYEGGIMVELQGFTGPWMPKKNYDFDLVDSEGLEMDTTLLGMPSENDWIFKAEYLDPSLMYNSIAYSFSRKMGRYAPRTVYCEVFVDGEYQGVFNLTEKVKRAEERVSIAKLTPDDIAGDSLTGGYIIEMNINGNPGAWNSNYLPINYNTCGLPVEYKNVYPKSWEIMPEQQEYIHAYVDSFELSLHQWNFADPEHGYRKWIGENSFIDFMLVNEMSTNYDSYGRSTFLYKEKITDGGQLKIGPPWDYDRGFCCVDGWVWELTHPGWPYPDWWSIFHQDSLFLQQEWCRWHELRESTWTTDAFMGYIDSLETLLAEPAARNFERWPELGYGDFTGNVEALRQRLTARLDWMDANIVGEGPCVPVLANGSLNLEDFESTFPPTCWSVLDVDGDGQNWDGDQPVVGHNGGQCAFSYSIANPDNFLVLPALHPADGEHLTWYVAGISDEATEFYQVLLSTTGSDPADFTTVLWEESYTGDHWSYRAADLSNWWGQDIYIAFRHMDSEGQFMLRLDDVRYPTWANPEDDCVVVSVESNYSGSFSMAPNPAGTWVKLIWPFGITPRTLKMVDAAGRKVRSWSSVPTGTEFVLDLMGLEPGIYSVTAEFRDGRRSTRPLILE